MALEGDTGNGATVTFATSSLALAADAQTIDIGEETIELLDVSKLSTTGYMERVASDLKDPPEVTLTVLFNTEDAAPTVGGAPETITVTFPLRTGQSAAATLAGTGVITSFKLPNLANGQVQQAQVKFKYDGDTGPTFTAATTS